MGRQVDEVTLRMVDMAVPLWDVSNGQGPRQLAELGLALVLSRLIG